MLIYNVCGGSCYAHKCPLASIVDISPYTRLAALPCICIAFSSGDLKTRAQPVISQRVRVFDPRGWEGGSLRLGSYAS